MTLNDINYSNIIEERLQTKARLVYSILVLIYAYFIPAFSSWSVSSYEQLQMVAPAFVIFSYAILLIIFVKKDSRFIPLRQFTSITIDISLISYAFFIYGKWSAAFLWLFLWVIIGNGMRFGIKYLLYAMTLGASLFFVTMHQSTYWNANIEISIGILLSLIILPLFFMTLITRFHNLKASLKHELEKTRYIANHDQLTSLPNRNYFVNQLKLEFLRAQRTNSKFSLLFMDLNGFKKVNDTYGHDFGDKVLVEVAEKLQAIKRQIDIIARIGGDEFMCLAITNSDSNKQLIERIKNLFIEPIVVDSITVDIGISIGEAKYPEDGDDINTLLVKSDKEMYKNKFKKS